MDRLPEKRFIGKICRFVRKRRLRHRSPRNVIIMYHGIGDSPGSVSIERFKAQMFWLKSHARVLGLEEMLRFRDVWNSSLRCVISFDDGCENLYRNAFPILGSLGLPAMAYIPAGVIGEKNESPPPGQQGLSHYEKMLSWKQLCEMSARDVTIGSHSFDHIDLVSVTEKEVVTQLERSKIQIEDRIGQSCSHFAYPFGRFDSRSIRGVEDVGYVSAVTAIHKGVTSRQHRFLLPRVSVKDNYTLRDFRSIIIGDWDFISAYQMCRNPVSVIRAFSKPRLSADASRPSHT